jgi:hypothetical protein
VNAPAPDIAPGRMCPADYVYPPSSLARSPDFAAETLYVAGGLYGNLPALATLREMIAAEAGVARLVLNGDFHWFDADPEWFAGIEAAAAPFASLRGNIETEVARPDDIGAGCGCAYPPDVEEATVRRSNAILCDLRAATPDAARARLRALPTHLVVQTGPLRIGVVHGDAASLAGWRFAPDRLDDPAARGWLSRVSADAGVDVFASTHTCLAALRDFAFGERRMTIINNGAAGMPNFAGSTSGVVTRIGITPSPHRPLYGMVRDGVSIDALPIHYDNAAFIERFLDRWPEGSAAHASYHRRITRGPDYTVAAAAG